MQFCASAACHCSGGLRPPKIAAVTKAAGGQRPPLEEKPFVIQGEPATFPARDRPWRRDDLLTWPGLPDQISERGRADRNNKITKNSSLKEVSRQKSDKTKCQEPLTPRPAGSDASAF